MKISFNNIEKPSELKVAVDNLGLRVAFFTTTTEGKPSIIYLGDVPFSKTPRVLISLYLFKDESGNKCIVFCGAVFEDDGSLIPIEVRITSEHVNAFMSDNIFFTFCNKIEKIEGDSIVCNRERTIVVPNTLDKEFISKLIEEMKNPGDEKEAWNNYLKKFQYPPCVHFKGGEEGK
jgi:hypothetical protein